MKHTKDFKREAVRIALSSGLSRTRVATDLGIGKSTLAKWIVDYRPDELEGSKNRCLTPRSRDFVFFARWLMVLVSDFSAAFFAERWTLALACYVATLILSRKRKRRIL
ncbi:transposase [Acetobacter estunensis]|uniref:transposase n=1 Tax=Acetobacter estunensis TaxID=104097 RepID=UPI00222EF0A4|nr:transposase [Acetobacter estunensis]